MSTRPTTKTDDIEILIAEDSPTQAMQLKYVLEEAGYRVAMASNGREALVLIRQRRPTLVITDIIMPEMDGYQLCEQIKGDAALRDIPVIVLTALSDAEDIIRAVKCGTDSFITKPYDEKYLVSTIQNILTSWDVVEINNERYLLGIVTDITERKRMQEKLIVTDRLASLGELAAGIA
ncbi:MAG: response regulator, partial [Chloroflexi bacterium]|nr:response regulator [Chloroflexota bacterium]